MSNVTLLLLVSGLALFLVFLILTLAKKNAFSFTKIGLLIASLVFVSGSLLNTLIETGQFDGKAASEVSNTEKKQAPKKPKPEEKATPKENQAEPKKAEKYEDFTNQDEEAVAEVLDEETEPQKIARELVEQEMAKQVGLKKWEITSNDIYSDKELYNIRDYDKPEGDMRVVWITGAVKATTEEDNITGSVGYDLELYQLKGEKDWRIGIHWGVLADLDVPEYK
jgi:hypothetical protein